MALRIFCRTDYLGNGATGCDFLLLLRERRNQLVDQQTSANLNSTVTAAQGVIRLVRGDEEALTSLGQIALSRS